MRVVCRSWVLQWCKSKNLGLDLEFHGVKSAEDDRCRDEQKITGYLFMIVHLIPAPAPERNFNLQDSQ